MKGNKTFKEKKKEWEVGKMYIYNMNANCEIEIEYNKKVNAYNLYYTVIKESPLYGSFKKIEKIEGPQFIDMINKFFTKIELKKQKSKEIKIIVKKIEQAYKNRNII